jgi:DNA-binding IclR family transcriptional regulator
MSRVLRLFDLLARQREGMTLSELSVALEVPKSTFLASLTALVSDGFLLNQGKVYTLGPSAFRLAGTIMAGFSMPDIVRYYVRDLGRATNESVGFAIADWEIGQVIYTDAVNSTQPVHYAMRVGIRAPLYASAAGRVLLAYAPAERQEAYFKRARFRQLTPATRTTPAAIRESLDAIVDQGYCASFGEMLRDTAALSVPIFDAAGANIGALMVAAPLTRMETNYQFLLDQLIRCGRQASGLAYSDEMSSYPRAEATRSR